MKNKKTGFTPLKNQQTKINSFFGFFERKSLLNSSRNRRNFLTGFTLVELLVVISIIGLLSSVVFASLNNARMKARDAKRLSDMKQIQTALELYYDKYGFYPNPRSSGTGAYNETAVCSWDVSSYDQNGDGYPFLRPLADEGFLSPVPVDPRQGTVNICSGFRYVYYRYYAGYRGCDPSLGDFYVLGVNNMETSGRPHPQSPGFSCPERNWQNEHEWVTGKFSR